MAAILRRGVDVFAWVKVSRSRSFSRRFDGLGRELLAFE
jgi:hypothetical protein